jgi:hypothetical protein
MPPFFVVFLVVFLADFFFAMASLPPFINQCMCCKNYRQRFFNSGTENLSPRRSALSRARERPRAASNTIAKARRREDKREEQINHERLLRVRRRTVAPSRLHFLLRARDNARHT